MSEAPPPEHDIQITEQARAALLAILAGEEGRARYIRVHVGRG